MRDLLQPGSVIGFDGHGTGIKIGRQFVDKDSQQRTHSIAVAAHQLDERFKINGERGSLHRL